MKKVLLLLAVLAAVGSMAFASSASAATSWPASCTKMLCVNNHLNNLDTRLRAQGNTIASLNQQIQDLQSRVTSLENFKASVNNKLSCISSQSVWQNYTYDFYGNYFQFLNINHTYVGGGGVNDGPFAFLTDSCGTF